MSHARAPYIRPESLETRPHAGDMNLHKCSIPGASLIPLSNDMARMVRSTR